jgi:hypothetical protein
MTNTDLPTAESQLRSFSFERLILWYHDLCAKRDHERRERWALAGCLYSIFIPKEIYTAVARSSRTFRQPIVEDNGRFPPAFFQHQVVSRLRDGDVGRPVVAG